MSQALDLPAAKPVVDHNANGLVRSLPSAECWWSQRPCFFTTGCRTICPRYARPDTTAPGLRTPPKFASPNPSTLWAFRQAWEGILAVDYRPVFEIGRKALDALPSHPEMALMMRRLADIVAIVSNRVAGLRHDLLGRIFHRVLDTARYDGSFYTSTAAAVLLASLALREEDGDWSDPNAVANLRICDPACGTGTLLMAASERIRALRMATGSLDP